MDVNLIARASAVINAPRDKVWQALVDPKAIQQYMFGTKVVSDWREGSPIVWKGEWQGQAYEDKGTILQLTPGQTLQYSHYSPLSGVADLPENYHTVTIELSDAGNQTQILLTQDKNTSEEERAHSQQNWEMMLAALKNYLEQL
jgi:uncharacterized protein YndB with AHSA1/START domain